MSVTSSGATVTKTFDYTLYTFTNTSTTGTITFPSNTTAQVLIVGGGGGGGNGSGTNYEGGGGGGGGGVGVGSLTFTAGASYTITIGPGGRGGISASGASNRSLNGTDTSISGTGINEIAYGGGKGADNSYNNVGGSGGSGGGGTGYGGANAGGSATKGTGNLTYYGNNSATAASESSGGGGGAVLSGISNVRGSGGAGGDGYYWDVTQGVYGSGGGGGSGGTQYSGYAGSGSGGGGFGGGKIYSPVDIAVYTATAGTANTGGGGGGGYGGSGTGGAGGSGVVIIAVPTRPWGAYIAGYGLNTTTLLYDITGNGRHATIGGSGLNTTDGSGNGTNASIPYITGTIATNITWPTGSIPSTFTLCSITRYNGGNKQRILQGLNTDFAHGHYITSTKCAYYNALKTSENKDSSMNWIVMCGTNGSTNTTPNNILANDVGVGTANGGSGNGQLTINNSSVGQFSGFAFNMVLIFDYALTNDELLSISSSMTSYLTTGNNAYFIQSTIIPIPKPWGSYIASNSDGTGIYEDSGNGRNATFGGTLGYNASSYLSAKQKIPILFGSDTVQGSITWPPGSIPSTFTICSISRYNGSTRRWRIFDGNGANWLHGHYSNYIGVAYNNNSWKTNVGSPTGRLIQDDQTDYVVMCSTNGTTNTTPYNILANGKGVGILNGGAGGYTLTINNGNSAASEWSGFAFNQVIIWDVALTNKQLRYMSDILQNYLSSGIMRYPWLAPPPYTFNPSIGLDTNSLIMYYPFDTNTLNYASGTGVASGTLYGGAAISQQYTKLASGSLYLDGSAQYFEPTTSYTLTTNGFTAAVWFRLKTFLTSADTTIKLFDFGYTPNTGSSGAAGTNNINLNFVYSSATSMTLNFVTVSKGSTLSTTSSFKLGDSKWHHYCVTISKSLYLTFYVDGLYSGGYQFRRTELPIGDALTNKCYIGKSNFSASQTILTNGYFNSFIIYDRCIESSELPSLLLIKNAILNGYFNSFRTPDDVADDASGNFLSLTIVSSLSNDSYVYSSSLMRVIPGWSFTGRCSTFLIQAGNNVNVLTSTLKLTSSQHYFIYVQFYQQPSTQTMQQVIRFTPGTYTLYYTVAGRPNDYDSTNTITSSISGGLLSNYTPTLSTTSWTTVSQKFTVTTEQLQALTFVFKTSTYIPGYTSIILRNVYIVKNNITNYLANGTDIANETDVNLYGTVPVIQSSINGLTIPITTITNNLFSNYYLKTGGQELPKNSPYYMHGNRNNTGFKVNGTDIGQYFQQTLPFDGSYGYCFETDYFAYSGSINANISSTEAKGIWPENTRLNQGSTSTAKVYYWLYYTFYYEGAANTGTCYSQIDDVVYMYFNNVAIGDPSGDSINILNGLNYIRVAVYNNGGTGTTSGPNPAVFIAALKDASGSVVAVTNSNWTWSLVPSNYATINSYNNISGSLPFSANITLSGTVYFNQLPINIADYITGAPSGTTYSPSQITTANGVGTYAYSSITLTLPSGYSIGTYSGSLTVLPSVVNLTMSGTVYFNQLPINISSYITGAPSGTTYSPSQITTTDGVGTYSFSSITVTLPSGYLAGTYSGSIVVNLTAFSNTSGTITTKSSNPTTLASAFSMPSGYNYFNFYIFGGGGSGVQVPSSSGAGGGSGGFISATSIPYSNGSNKISSITYIVASGGQSRDFSKITVNYSDGSSISLIAYSGYDVTYDQPTIVGIGGTTSFTNNATGFYNSTKITNVNGVSGGAAPSGNGSSSGYTSSGSGGSGSSPATNTASATFTITAQDGTVYTNTSIGGGNARVVSGYGSGGAATPPNYLSNAGAYKNGTQGVIYYTLSAT